MRGHRARVEDPEGIPALADLDFDRTPFIVFWEVTRACALACLHCRAVAQPRRHPLELTPEEGFRLIDRVAEMGAPLLVLTGGDPMMRPDLYEFIRHGVQRGLRMSLAPSATRLVNPQALAQVKEAGLARISFSLDGSRAEVHDAFRQTPGSFQRTLDILGYIRDAGLSLQINSTVSRYNLHDLPALAEKVAQFGAVLWSVFFLVPTGRGQKEDMISPQQHEEVFNWLYDLSQTAPFGVKTTAAEHYRRVVIQRRQAEAGLPATGEAKLEVTARGFEYADGIGRAPKGVNDGKGCCFISHIGEVCPSGFLPLPGGNVREKPLSEVYRNSPLFRDLRDPAKLKGKCGRCEFNQVCGGSRARAYAVTGDYLAAEPYCVYQPRNGSKPELPKLDLADQRVIHLLQADFPLESEPFRAIGQKVGLTPGQVRRRINTLKEEGLVRHISALFDARRLGYRSTLAALRLPPERLEEAGYQISQHPGVSHNYSRDHVYNLWFTLTLPASADLEGEVRKLAHQVGAEAYLHLPALKLFKLRAIFSLEADGAVSGEASSSPPGEEVKLSPLEQRVVRGLQEDLPLVERPFQTMAAGISLSEAQLLSVAQGLKERGILRRFGAQLNHRRAGFEANGLGCWKVPEVILEAVGKLAATFPAVSHCYERLACPDWPYNLYTMIHGRRRQDGEAVARQISTQTGIQDYLLLFSLKEYKKVRVKYLV